jgi:hypothetical protein
MFHQQVFDVMAGKFVSEAYKEVHKKSWTGDNTGAGQWELFKQSFRTEARWRKAIQYLRDNGQLDNSPRDIGPLIKQINEDIKEEEEGAIKDGLYRIFGKDVLRVATAGFAEWYKEQLAFGDKNGKDYNVEH